MYCLISIPGRIAAQGATTPAAMPRGQRDHPLILASGIPPYEKA
jgi:hypothetical protein